MYNLIFISKNTQLYDFNKQQTKYYRYVRLIGFIIKKLINLMITKLKN